MVQDWLDRSKKHEVGPHMHYLCRPSDVPVTCFDIDLTPSLITASPLNNWPIYILGDANCNMLKPDSTESVALANFCHSFNLSQMVSSPTRVTDTTESLIDVIITSNTKQALEVGVKQCSISDHDLVYAVLRLKKERPKPVYITTRSFKHYQPEKFYADTYQVP